MSVFTLQLAISRKIEIVVWLRRMHLNVRFYFAAGYKIVCTLQPVVQPTGRHVLSIHVINR